MTRRQFFDDRAGDWEERNPVDEARLARLLAAAELGPGLRVLDVGTGNGRLVPGILEATAPFGEVTALDPSENMLAVARRRHPSPRVRWIRANLEEFEGRPGEFHRIICHAVFPHFFDAGRALGVAHRSLVPGGLLVIAHTVGRDRINARHEKAGGAVETDVLPPAGELSDTLRRIGFHPERVRDEPDFYLVTARRPSTTPTR